MHVVQKLLKVLAFSVSKFRSQIQHRIQLFWYYPLISLQAIFVYSIFYRSVCTYNELFVIIYWRCRFMDKGYLKIHESCFSFHEI